MEPEEQPTESTSDNTPVDDDEFFGESGDPEPQLSASGDDQSEPLPEPPVYPISRGYRREPDLDPIVSDERAFRVIELRVAPDGSVSARLRRELAANVYTVPVAEKLTRQDALRLPNDEAILLLVRPSGSAVVAFASGTGRRAPRSVMLKARRALKQLMPQLFRSRPRRSSRPDGVTKKRRSSREGARNRRRTSRRETNRNRRKGRR